MGCRASPHGASLWFQSISLGSSRTSLSQAVPNPGTTTPLSSLPALLSFHSRAGHLQPCEDPPRLHQRHRPGGLQHLETSFPEPLRLHVRRASRSARPNPSGCTWYVSQAPWDRVLVPGACDCPGLTPPKGPALFGGITLTTPVPGLVEKAGDAALALGTPCAACTFC